MLRIDVRVKGLPQARQAMQRVKEIVEDTEPFTFAALNKAAKHFDKNFLSEGGEVGGWASLADATVRERERKGFGGEHPILVRYGDLRRVTATSLMTARGSGTFAATDADGKTIQVNLKTNRGVLNVSALGDKAINQVPDDDRPARPYWFVNRAVQESARGGVVDRLVKEIWWRL